MTGADHQRRRHRRAGLRTLARVAADAGLDVVVAAPARDSSGAAASLTAVAQTAAS